MLKKYYNIKKKVKYKQLNIIKLKIALRDCIIFFISQTLIIGGIAKALKGKPQLEMVAITVKASLFSYDMRNEFCISSVESLCLRNSNIENKKWETSTTKSWACFKMGCVYS